MGKKAPWVGMSKGRGGVRGGTTAGPAPKKAKRRWLRGVSPKRSRELREYSARRKQWLRSHRVCAVFPDKLATEVHHVRGRANGLLLAERYWLPVSRAGHEWIGSHPAKAASLGWLCDRGKWNVGMDNRT
jgi:hypothetical protein